MNLYFEDRYGNFRLITKNISEEEAFEVISETIHQMNPNFKIYYIRTQETPEGICYDVGSHTEFFYLSNRNLA